MAQSVFYIDTQVDEYMEMGDFYFQTAQSAKAIGSYKMCLSLITNRNAEMVIYHRLGAAHQSLGKYDKAIEYHRKSLSIATENGLWHFEGYACKTLACAYYLSGKLNEAVEYYEKCLSIITKTDDRELLGEVYGELGVVYQSLQKYQQAVACHKKCLCIATETGNKQIEGTAHANLGIVYTSLARYDEAAEHYRKRLSVAKEIGDRQGEGKAYGYLGNVHHALGKYYEAIECHEKHLSIVMVMDDKEEEGNACSGLGDAYRSLGRYHEAIEYFEKRLSIAKEIGDRQGEANGYSSLGNVYLSLGKTNEAIEYQQQILSIVMELGDRHGQGTTYGNIGSAYIQLEKYSEAIKYLQKQVNIAVELGDKQGEGVGYGNIGNAYIALGEYDKAIEYCKKSLSIAREIGNRKIEGTAYGKLASAFGHIGDFRKTLEYDNKHLSIAMEIGDREGEGVAHSNIGNVYKTIANKDGVDSREFLGKSKEHLQKSIECFEELFDNLQEKDQFKISIFDTFINAYKNLSQVFIRTENTEKALLTCESGRARALGDLLSFKYSMNKETTPRKCSLADIFEILSNDDVCILSCDLPLNRVTTHFWVISPQPQQVCFLDVESTEPDLSEDNQQELVKGFFKNLVEKSYTDIKAREVVNCEDRSLDILAREDEQSVKPKAGSKVSQGTQARCAYEEEEEDKPLEMLFEKLIEPVKHKLTQDEIVIIPDGPLFMVPFAALQDPETGKFLSETKRIRLAPSFTTLKILQEASDGHHCKSGALIVGNPEIGKVKYRGKERWFSPLSGAENEAIEIGNLLGVEPLIGKQASKEAILQKLQVGVSVIHFAAHGSINGQILLSPSESSQVSSIPEEKDYVLTMKEAQESGVRAQLVVLSCCHSGRGEIKSEGVVGMARAFLAAGARSVLASLWAIADEPTKIFMLKFYSHLKKGESASKSLQQAMKEMRETEVYKEPRYWAAFFLIGDDVTISVS